MTLNIPSAEEASKSVESYTDLKAANQGAQIESAILAAIKAGQRSIGGNGHLFPSVKAALEALGYRCTEGDRYNESCWGISWLT